MHADLGEDDKLFARELELLDRLTEHDLRKAVGVPLPTYTS